MSEDRTAETSDPRSFEARVFARFDALDARLNEIDSRLTTLEEKVDQRLKETRPIWEQVLNRLDKVEERLSEVDDSLRNVGRKFDVVAQDLLEVRADQRHLDNRLDKLERNLRTITIGLCSKMQRIIQILSQLVQGRALLFFEPVMHETMLEMNSVMLLKNFWKR